MKKHIIIIFVAFILILSVSMAESVTYQELYGLFDSAVEAIMPDQLSDWQSQNQSARNAENFVTRSSAMVAVFNLAEFLGPDYFCFNSWDTIDWESSPWENDDWNVDDYWGDTLRFPYGFNGNYESDGSNYGGSAYFYSMGRVSLISSEPILEKGRCSILLSKEEAETMVQRFYESGLKVSERILTALDEEVLSKAEVRKQQILNSQTEIKANDKTGKIYYVSIDGRDNNSGLSPEKPWKTLEKVSKADLKKGDMVFFKRGDIWREEALKLQAGVIYSAYGEGPKPAFYGSPENGASPEKWNLLDGTSNIWVFYKDILECGYIVLDEGIRARKIAPYLENGRYTMPDGSGLPFSVSDALIENLMFYSSDDSFERGIDVYQTFKNPGKLYLRCDEGNPGEVFSSIEFCPWMNTRSSNKALIYTADKPFRDMGTVDNLCLKYTGLYGFNLGGSSVTVQNCEVGWCGGCYTDYLDNNALIEFGNCVGSYGEIDGYKVLNSYLYQAFDSGISNEGNTQYMRNHKNIIYSGNLIENCVYGIEMFIENWDPDIKAVMEDITVSDNIIMNSGYGFGTNRQYKEWESDTAIMMHAYYNDLYNVIIEDNIFYRSKTFLLCNMMNTRSEKARFRGNTYVQDNFGSLCIWRAGDDLPDYLFDGNADTIVKNKIGDETAVVANLSMEVISIQPIGSAQDEIQRIEYPVAVMPKELVDNGILNNDFLFLLPFETTGNITLIYGEDLDARIEDGQFWIDKIPEEEGTTLYKVGDTEIVLNKVFPETLPEDAVLIGNGKDIRDQTVTVQAGEKIIIDCHFVPADWKFQGQAESISVWLNEGEGEWEAECEGTQGELCVSTPGEYGIGVMVTSGNAVAYRFFTLIVKR